MNFFYKLSDIVKSEYYEDNETTIVINKNLPKENVNECKSYIKDILSLMSSFSRIKLFSKSNDSLSPSSILEFNELEIDVVNKYNNEMIENEYEIKIYKNKLIQYLKDENLIPKDINVIVSYKSNHLYKKFSDLNFIDNIGENQSLCLNLNDSIFIYNGNFLFCDLNTLEYYKFENSIINHDSIINNRNKLCNWNNGTKNITPDDIYFDFNNPDFKLSCNLKHQLIKQCTDLIMKFISNYSGYENGKFISRINGTKTINIDYETNKYSLENLNTMYDIYSWVYEEKTESRIIALRNVITTLISAKCNKHCVQDNYGIILDNCKWILKSVKDNYKIFMESNITEFFKQKNTLMEDTLNQINSIIEKTDKIITNMNTNLIAFMGTIITGIIAYLNNGNILILKVVLILYIIYLILISIFFYTQQINKFKTTKKIFNDKYDDYTKKYIEDENIIKVKETFNKNKKHFWAYFYSSITIYIIIIIVIIYSMSSSLLPDILNSNKEKKDIEKQQEQIDSQNNKINELEQYIKELEKKYNEFDSENINNNESNQ